MSFANAGLVRIQGGVRTGAELMHESTDRAIYNMLTIKILYSSS